jgi:hypothetical protein
VPVVGHKDTVLTRAERELSCSFDACLSKHAEPLGIVHIVRSGFGAIQLRASLTPHLQLYEALSDLANSMSTHAIFVHILCAHPRVTCTEFMHVLQFRPIRLLENHSQANFQRVQMR